MRPVALEERGRRTPCFFGGELKISESSLRESWPSMAIAVGLLGPVSTCGPRLLAMERSDVFDSARTTVVGGPTAALP